MQLSEKPQCCACGQQHQHKLHSGQHLPKPACSKSWGSLQVTEIGCTGSKACAEIELAKTCRLNTTTTTKSKHQNAPPSKAQTGRQHLSSNNADHAKDSTQPSHCCLAITYALQSNSVALHFHPCRGSATAFVVAAVLPTSAQLLHSVSAHPVLHSQLVSNTLAQSMPASAACYQLHGVQTAAAATSLDALLQRPKHKLRRCR